MAKNTVSPYFMVNLKIISFLASFASTEEKQGKRGAGQTAVHSRIPVIE
jgi:hypothetical protein